MCNVLHRDTHTYIYIYIYIYHSRDTLRELHTCIIVCKQIDRMTVREIDS